mmetsp:Transcript_13630/g.31368  ORF Transcript_13630/g.31368 Transcript_13630/m.31368 type:complete len:94 (+) Transcript_13630:1726-2007(+)
MAEHNVQQHFDRSVSQASFGRLRAEFFNAHSKFVVLFRCQRKLLYLLPCSRLLLYSYQGLCGAQHGTTQAGLGRPGNDAMNAGNVNKNTDNSR